MTSIDDRRVAIVGGGLVGSAWGAVFARAGFRVRMFDASHEVRASGLARVEGILGELEDEGLLDAEPADVTARVTVCETLADALAGAEYVQECAPEILDTKRRVIEEISLECDPSAVIASSTSGFVPSAFMSEALNPERCVVAHPINPVHLHDVVEVVPAPWTDGRVIETASAVLRIAGLSPIVLRHETDGFVVNRLQSAVLHECFRLLSEGVTSAVEIDRAVVGALAQRWSIMGPFETIDLNAPGGIADYVSRYGPMYARLGSAQTERVSWQSAIEAGLADELHRAYGADHAARVIERDRRLAHLARQRRAMNEADQGQRSDELRT